MKDRYHFSNGIGNQSMGKTKKQVTLHIDKDAIACFKNQAADTGISYQNLINLYLRDCVANESPPGNKQIALHIYAAGDMNQDYSY